MDLLVLKIIGLITCTTPVLSIGRDQFLAAAYEHQLILNHNCYGGRICTSEEAREIMEDNFNVYRSVALQASLAGAKILLLPEDGLGAFSVNREGLEPFLEVSPQVGDNPCFDKEKWSPSTDFAKISFSCLAMETSMYISIDFATYLPGCQECGDGENCFYNTQIVFDNFGTVVAVYHKYNLWTGEDLVFNIEKAPAIEYFDTEFGRFGLLICEDLLWDSPTLELVRDFNVDTLLVPLYWYDLFPHQVSHSTEEAWARGLQTNLLAANIHAPAGQTSGSGIFSPSGAVEYYHNVSYGSPGRLMIAALDIHPAKYGVSWNQYAVENAANYPDSGEEFQETVYADLYNFVPLKQEENQAKVCTEDGSLCCLADYAADFKDIFSLGVFKGSHYKDGSVRGSFHMEMCTIIKCDPKHSYKTCNQDLSYDYRYLSKSDTVFHHVNISASFSEGTIVYPEVIFDDLELLPQHVFISDDGVLGLRSSEEEEDTPPLLSISLFGRNYALDADLPEAFCPGSLNI